MDEKKFSIEDTLFAKGIALCLLLIHHLFFYESNQYIDILINGRQFSNILSEFAKVCVAMFLFMSGYGLNESTNNNKYNIFPFYKKHLLKIYLNYWLIWILFVPIGILFFNRTLGVAYEEHYIFLKLLINVLGLQYFFDYAGYNPTWWFITTIITLYILFPFLKIFVYKYKKWALFASFVMIYIWFIPDPIRKWTFPFMLGIFSSQNNTLERAKTYMSTKKIKKIILYILIIIFSVFFRHYLNKLLRGVALDGIFGIFIILIGYEYISKNALLRKIFIFIGSHSFNIFLFHTFIYYYYFENFSYVLQYPPLIFLQLLLVCLAISIVVENIKTLLGLKKI